MVEVRESGSGRDDPLPLPQFIVQFLKDRGIRIDPEPGKRRDDVIKGTNTLGKSITTLVSARTLQAIRNAYKAFLQQTYVAPVMLQRDWQQFIFPFFIHLAAQLYQLHREEDAQTFVNMFRADQPRDCSEMIDQLLRDKERFVAPRFDIQINQFALEALMRQIEKGKQALLSFIINTQINIRVEAYHHKLLNVNVADATRDAGQILPPVDCQQKPLSVKFHPDHPEKLPSIEQTGDNKVLLTQCLPDVAHIVLYNHNNRISDARISPCARLLGLAQDSNIVIGSLDSSTGLPTPKSSSAIAPIASHAGRALSLSFSSDCRYVVSGGMDNQVRVAHLEAFRPLAHFKLHIEPVLSVAVDRRSEFFLGGSQDRIVSMWSLRVPTCVRAFVGHTLPVCNVAFSQDSTRVISCSSDLTLKVWDVGMGKPIAHFCCGESMPVTLGVHPRNGYIACGCVDGSVVLWKGEEGELVWASRPYASRITDVAFSGDGSLLYGATLDGQFCAWNVASGASDCVMHGESNGSTIDSITVTERNLVCTTGRSLRGIVI
jgi:hypothetical protein